MKRVKTVIKVLAVLLMAGALLFLLIYGEKSGNISALAEGTKEEKPRYVKSVDIKGSEIEYNGKRYKYNDHLTNFLFLGIDKRELADTVKGAADAGQSDAIFLVSMDRMSGKTALISIPRDTMTMIVGYTVDQEPLLLYDHLSVQYGYGDGRHGSCNLSKDAVSSLMYSLPIQGYCAIALDALTVIAGEMGDLEVTIPNDSLAFKDDEFKAGSTVVLDKDNIELFLRVRDTQTQGSPLMRLERQKMFLEAFLERAAEKYAEDNSMISDFYEELKPYMVTNMGNDQFVRLLRGATERDDVTRWTVPGEASDNGMYDEYHVHEDELLQLLLQTVCVEY
ncbi:MAG: LCP family protein [Lachnospiraceae bacterium]|nr:LCP family protein [Lachnospiraceae bacterium]